MGRLQRLTNLKPIPTMDIDPRPTYHSLCPTFIDPRRTKLLKEDNSGHVIGSPPPAAPPKTQWNENFEMEVPIDRPKEGPQDKASTMDTSELTSRVQDIRLQPPQPMIICETVEDVKTDEPEMKAGCSVSLTVPAVDFTDEKKRPPMSAPY